MDIFEYTEYQKLIEYWLEHSKKHGARAKLAKAIGCSPSWITRVLAEQVHLTPDQAFGISIYFNLNEAETDYFLLLVELQRSGTHMLKKRIHSKLKLLRENTRNFGASVKTDSKMSEQDHARYYSTWLFSALHAACMIRNFSSLELARIFKIPSARITEILNALQSMGLVIKLGEHWQATSKSIHLSSESPMANIAHANLRNRSIQVLQEGTSDGLHYSAIHCLSKKDVEIVRQKLKNAILSCRNVIEPSPPETLSVLCLDWYEQSLGA